MGTQLRGAVALVGAQKGIDFGVVNPGKQMRIVRRVLATVRGGADNALMDSGHESERGLGLFSGAEGGGCNELTGVGEAIKRMAAVVRVISNASHCERVHRLQEQCSNAGNEH
jgi:hypothetical protein